MESIPRFTCGPECYSGHRCNPSSLQNHSKFIVSYLVLEHVSPPLCTSQDVAEVSFSICLLLYSGREASLYCIFIKPMQIKATYLFVFFVVLHTIQVAFLFPHSQPFALFCSFLKIIQKMFSCCSHFLLLQSFKLSWQLLIRPVTRLDAWKQHGSL